MKHALLAATLAAVIASPPAWAQQANDEDKEAVVDPVCLMNITKGMAQFIETFQGDKYWFCNQNCHKSFMENPGKYAATVQKVRDNSYLVSYFTRPAKIYSNTDTQVYFNVEKNGAFKEPVTWTPKSLSAECEVTAELAGGKTQTFNSSLKFRPMKEAGWFGSNARFSAPGRVQIRVRVVFDDGKDDEAVFKLPIVMGVEFETGKENEGKRMDMIVQHETMRKGGKYWTSAGLALRAGDLETAKKDFQFVKAYQKYFVQMLPHVHEDEMDEFNRLDAEYAAALVEYEKVLNSGDKEKAIEGWNRMDALQCTKCHMKFRWSTFADLKNYPIRGGESK